MAGPDFWNNQDRAQLQVEEVASLRKIVGPFLDLEKKQADLEVLHDFALQDSSMLPELEHEHADFQKSLDHFELQQFLSGPNDRNNCFLTIHSGAGGTDKTHQSERLEGSDCADFVTYGWRRLGHKVPYTWSEGLRDYTTRLATGAKREDGIYVDDRGKPIAFPQPGDLILFPRHVGALSVDRGVKGVLDVEDLMVHALFQSPAEVTIGESGYADTHIDVVRWKP